MTERTLNQTTRDQITRDLDRSAFGADLFEQAYDNEPDVVRITFIPKPDFVFAIRPAKHGWEVIESPGETFVQQQEVTHADFAWCRARMAGWVQRVDRECAPPRASQSEVIEEIKATFFKYADSLPENDRPLSSAELAEWEKKLDRVVSRLEKLEQERGLQAGAIDDLKKKLDNLGKLSPTTPRGAWVRAVGAQVINTVVSAAVGALAAQIGDELGGKVIALLMGGPKAGD